MQLQKAWGTLSLSDRDKWMKYNCNVFVQEAVDSKLGSTKKEERVWCLDTAAKFHAIPHLSCVCSLLFFSFPFLFVAPYCGRIGGKGGSMPASDQRRYEDLNCDYFVDQDAKKQRRARNKRKLFQDSAFSRGLQIHNISVDDAMDGVKREMDKYIELLFEFSEQAYASDQPPANTTINTSAPPLLPLNCDQRPFAGRRSTPALLVDLLPYNGEADAVEIRLHELSDIIDRFILLESPVSHHLFRKPLFFQRQLPRFLPFLHRISLVYDDDADVSAEFGSSIFNSSNYSNYQTGVFWDAEIRMRRGNNCMLVLLIFLLTCEWRQCCGRRRSCLSKTHHSNRSSKLCIFMETPTKCHRPIC